MCSSKDPMGRRHFTWLLRQAAEICLPCFANMGLTCSPENASSRGGLGTQSKAEQVEVTCTRKGSDGGDGHRRGEVTTPSGCLGWRRLKLAYPSADASSRTSS
eukprot:Rhum_TRINITY_DN15388_c2_g1::Rhum_TRINITY_DN15388_c2_g1_i11::g.153668::m.153668